MAVLLRLQYIVPLPPPPSFVKMPKASLSPCDDDDDDVDVGDDDDGDVDDDDDIEVIITGKRSRWRHQRLLRKKKIATSKILLGQSVTTPLEPVIVCIVHTYLYRMVLLRQKKN